MIPRWLLYALATVLLWGAWALLSRKLGDAMSAEQTLVVSTLGLLPIIAVLGWRLPRRGGGRPARGPVIAALSGLVGGVGNLVFYQLLQAGERAATIVPFTALYPLVTVVLAMVFLRERLAWTQWGGIGLALAAIYCFNVGREAAALDRWFLLALAPLALWGSSALLQKICTNDIPGDVSTFWFLIGLLPVTLVVWATQPMKSGLPSSAWLLAVLMGLFLGLGNLTLLAAYAKNGKASVITPMAGLYPLVSVPLAVLWFGERVNAREWIGILLALAAVIALTAEPRREEPNQPPARNADAGAC